MARAHEHLASARYAEAAGAFRAVLRIDPNEFQAHFGLADALVARGQHGEAVEGLVAAAESCTAREDHGAALTLYGKALAVDPMRLELHLDVAMAEAALGRMEAAQSRLEHLAEVYMQAGRTDEAAEVYRCLAGWEEGEEGEEVEEIDEADEAPPQRSTQVPTAAPAQPPPRGAVPMSMMPTSETVVIPTILITPDGQLYQVPIEQQAEAWAPASDSVPRVPAELLEVVHSAPIDLAAGGEIEDVERTVVAYPPPPPSLPENYESAAHTVNRKELEAAVVAAMNNLAQLEEEDQTLIMQRLPPQSKTASHRTRSGESRLPEFVTRSRMPKPELPPEMDAELEEAADLEASVSLQLDENFAAELAAGAVLEDAAEAYAEPEPEPVVQEPAPESKLRINRAPRPPAKPSPVAAAAAAGRASASSSPGKPAAARPISPARAGGGRRVSPPEAAPARASASKPAGATSKPAAAPARASTPAGAGKPAAAPARASAPAGASKPAAPARASASKPAAPARASASKPAAPARASASKPATMTSKPAASPVRASTPAGASKPAGSPARASAASKPAGPPARAGTSSAAGKPAPSDVPPPGGSRPPAGAAARPASAVGSARPPGGEAPKPTRPDNPLAERLRRRAGLQKPDASPSRAEPRGTEPIIVRSPSSLPPRSKK